MPIRKSPLTILLVCSLLTAVLFVAPALAEDITFQVRMQQQILMGLFQPTVDSVDLAGSFNGWGSELTPLDDAEGDSVYTITLDGFTAGDHIEYKFRINGQWNGTEEFPGVGNNRTYTVQSGENLIDVWYNDYEPGDGQVEEGELSWWNDAVFYEIFVRSFCDSDGDGIGDLPGLTAKLDYLNDGDPATSDDLGITGIWLMPINDSPSYHGYDAVDYRSINPDYGTMDDFEAFLAAAHARGIKVIIDYVMNHCSNQHPWFVQAAAGNPSYRDFFRWSTYDPGQSQPWGGGSAWHWDDSGWYYGVFWSGMPDLNYDSPALKSIMFETATFWLETVGVDGFRLDAVLYIDEEGEQQQTTDGTLQFWQDYNAHVKSVNPDVLSVGEAWTNSNEVLEYVSEDRLDICFEFEQAGAILGAVNNGDAGWVGAKSAQVYNQYPYLQYATFLTNHDQDRVFTVLGEDEGKNRAAAALYLTLPGVPFLYYGEEIGMTGSGAHENIRTPMQWNDSAGAGFTTGTPWQPINGNHTSWNVAGMTDESGSLLSWYRQLIHARNASAALRQGTLSSLSCDRTPVMAHARKRGAQTVVCLINTGSDNQNNLTVGGLAGLIEPGEHEVADLLSPGDTLVLAVTEDFEIRGLDVAGHGTLLLEFMPTSDAADDSQLPPAHGLRLEQNHPNPFNPGTLIRYHLTETAPVQLGVYDVAGRRVARLVEEVQEAGSRIVSWDGRDQAGRTVGAGVYFARLVAGGQSRVVKMVLAK
jgi:alpha-amylase